MKNLLKYTLGLPYLILISVIICCFYLMIIIFDFITLVIFDTLLYCDYKDDINELFENLWKPYIKEK